MNPPCEQWANALAPPPRQNFVRAELFRFTKTFTERCWSNRRSRHKFLGIRKNRQTQTDQRSAAFSIFNDHLRGIAVQNFQTLGHIGHANSASAQPIGLLQQLSRSHSDTVILHLNHQPRLDHAAAQRDAAAFDLRSKPMLDAILDERLQQHARNHRFKRWRIEVFDDVEFVTAKAHDFNIEVIVDELDLLAKRNKRIGTVQQPPKNGRKLQNHLSRRIGIEAHQRRNGIQRIEEKVRIDLILQSRHARLQEQPFLFLQFELNADAVKNLQLCPHHQNYREVDCAFHQICIQISARIRQPEIWALQA